jgi:hypothetical protein
MAEWMKKTCALCPFSRTKTLFLHPERAEEFAYMAQNPYNDFPCHKTAEYEEETAWHDGGFVAGEHSKTCHGFMTLQAEENGLEIDGFTPDGDGFQSIDEMLETHEDLWEAQQRSRKERAA